MACLGRRVEKHISTPAPLMPYCSVSRVDAELCCELNVAGKWPACQSKCRGEPCFLPDLASCGTVQNKKTQSEESLSLRACVRSGSLFLWSMATTTIADHRCRRHMRSLTIIRVLLASAPGLPPVVYQKSERKCARTASGWCFR